MYRDYSPRGVKFYYIYKALAHPETNSYVTPYDLQERLLHVAEAERTLGSEIPWICDTMSNDLKHALGNAPNSEFIIDPDGKVVRRRSWSSPAQVRSDLEELVGPVENPTKVADLVLKRQPPPEVAARGVVPRIQLPGNMKPVIVEPAPSKQPYYAKLRAEADPQLLGSGSGKLYLGFHLDPLYHVHWNNLAAPVKFELTVPEGAHASPANGEGPQVQAESDSDPREFLIDVELSASRQPLELAVHYFACNSEEGWCKPVTQRYAVRLEVDADGGRAQGRGRPARSRPSNAGGAAATRRAPQEANLQRVMGIVARVDVRQRTLTIRSRDGQEQELLVAQNATVMQNRRRIRWDQLRPGDRVMAGVDPQRKDEQGRPTLVRLMSREP